MKKFLLGLVTAVVLGTLVNTTLGYIRFGYSKNVDVVDKDVKSCKDLAASIAAFGDLKVNVIGNGKPVENLEVDLSKQPGPVRCMRKTDGTGAVVFKEVPAGQMFIFFNNSEFPKEFGHPPTEAVIILKGQVVEKTLYLKTQ